jgi:hypothetical protein
MMLERLQKRAANSSPRDIFSPLATAKQIGSVKKKNSSRRHVDIPPATNCRGQKAFNGRMALPGAFRPQRKSSSTPSPVEDKTKKWESDA